MAGLVQSFGFPLSIVTKSDVGCVRTNNEDSCGFAWLDDSSLFVIVADGMGGHEAGEVASGLAVQVVEEAMSRDPEGDPRERLYHALIEANEAILEEGEQSGTRGMGTTSIVALARGREVYVGLIGDSRCYHFRRGHLLWRTQDHTRVQMLLEQGQISEEEARTHPEAGMLTRALGHARMADGRPLEPDVLQEPVVLEVNDTLIMSSDGMHDLIEDWEIGQLIAGKTGAEAAASLIELAKERGGHDNITVAILNTSGRSSEYDPSFSPPAWNGGDDGNVAESTDELAEDLGAGLGFGPSAVQSTAGGEIRVAAPVAVTAQTMVLDPDEGPVAAARARLAAEQAGSKNSKMYLMVGCGVLSVLGLGGAVLALALVVLAWLGLGG